ncbi:MAG: cell division protein FtsQ/DivIB [Neisseria sp.]|nr:cell division protein FtsQ/DivIB [Neisseria sp.]
MWDNVQVMRRLSGWLLVLVFLLLAVSGAVWLYHSHYFPIKQIKIEGNLKHADAAEIQAVAQKYIRGNILRADLNGAQGAFAQMPWIADAQVSRLLPDTVYVKLTERVPVARWDKDRLVDSSGELFTVPYDAPLPLFAGQEGAEKEMVEHLAVFQTALKPAKLAVQKLIYTPRSAWSIILDNGLTVRLGRERERERLNRFTAVWQPLIAPKAEQLEYVDMRYKDGFAVRKRKVQKSSAEAGKAPAKQEKKRR